MFVEPAAEYIAIATYLPMRRYHDVPAFLLLARRVLQQALGTEGNIAANAIGNPLTKKFRTYTVWRDRAALNAFTRAEPHLTAIRRMADWTGEGAAFAEWTTSSPLDRLGRGRAPHLKQPTYYYKKPA